MACIILVEDNNLIREAVSGYLKLEGHSVVEFSGISGVMESVRRNIASLIVLDVMLPDGSGFALAKAIRAESSIPLVFLTAKDSESDRILGFELGADDYICKPFSAKELVLRIQALLRRSGAGGRQGSADPSGLWQLKEGGSGVLRTARIDTLKHELTVNGAPVVLTSAEWKILTFLAANCDQVVSREQILSECFNYFFEGSERTVDTHIANVRAKLGSGWIATVRGYGYRFNGFREAGDSGSGT